MWNIQLLNRFGLNLQSGTMTHVEETLLWNKTKLCMVLKYTSSCLTLNHLIIIGKYFLYINGVHAENRPQFTDFVTLANEKNELDKYIATTTNKLLFYQLSKQF